ncbi:MAG TPA: TIGR03618 family F420-dependent PPOX class oxidoreductase [Acidimicrobiales bacterium]
MDELRSSRPGQADRLVHAAGGVVWRPGRGGSPDLLLIHRPLYDDWSFPKGKRASGEDDETCALREILEETGLRCELGVELATVAYIDRRGRPKEVRYWACTVLGGYFRPNDEVDEVRWLPASAAVELLTYERDHDLVKTFLRRVWSRQVHPASHRTDGGSQPATAGDGEAVPYHPMSRDEWRAFLLDPPRPGVVATVRADGRPHAAPVWFDLDGDSVVFTTGADTVKGRNLTRDPRVTLCVQDDRPPFSFVALEGTVELVDDLELVRTWATRLGGRYMGAAAAESYGERNGVPGELVVRFIPTAVVSAVDLAD